MNRPFPQPLDRAWLDVDLDAFVRNAERVATVASPARLLPMVKADAYGIGALEAARALEPLDPYAFGVATLSEGQALRAGGVQRRIIVFAPAAVIDAEGLLEAGLDASVMSLASLEAFGRAAEAAGSQLDIHLEIDTGMGRAGVPAREIETWLPGVAAALSSGSLSLASAYTHFHSAGENPGATEDQLASFTDSIDQLRAAGIPVPLTHAANSDAVMRHAQYHLDLVRPGIYLYGGRRGAKIGGSLPDPEGVVRVRARVLEVRDLAPGSTVSYGANYTTGERERLATLGIGYADGIPWRLSNRGNALIEGKRVPIRGNVCMDVVSVDVSRVPGVQAGGIATLLGRDGDEEISLADLAEIDQTIEYEILTAIGRRLPRRYADRDVVDERGS